jgi:PIN domain nuclease of toxin-antitoxin system
LENATSVLDASALLAYLNDEPGASVVEHALVRRSAISAVNLAEVLSKLAEIGEDPNEVSETLQGLGGRLAVFPLTADDAIMIARLVQSTKSRGLSLGDRACLGLALRLQVPAVTADRAWLRLKVAAKVEAIR